MSLSVGRWLASFGMQQYASNFAQHGYDLRTVARMSPSDLAAIRIGHPAHREKISSMVAQLRRDPSLCSMPSNQNPISLEAWLDSMGLGMYSITFARAGITSMERLAGTSWEDLQVSALLGFLQLCTFRVLFCALRCKRTKKLKLFHG